MSPSTQKIEKQSTVELECNATHVESWQFYGKDNNDINLIGTSLTTYFKSSNTKIYNDRKSIKIEKFQSKQVGVYVCVGYNNLQEGYFFAAGLVLVQGKGVCSKLR